MSKSKRLKFRNTAAYFIKEGFSNIFLHGFMSFAAVGVIAVCLLLTGSFFLIALNLDRLVSEIGDQSEIVVFIDEALSTQEAMAVKDQIMKIDNIRSAEFVSRDTALENYRESLGENSDLLDGIDENPLRDSFTIKMKDISQHAQTEQALAEIPQIAKTNSRRDVSAALIQIRQTVHGISLGIIVVLGLISVFIVSNTIKLATFTRRQEIAIMKMVGATNAFIRWPFVVEGLVLGLFGALIGLGLEWVAYNYLSDTILKMLDASTLVSFSSVLPTLAGAFAGAGLIFGVGGSVLTIRKYLKV